MQFTYNLPVNLLFGAGRADTLGQVAKAYGSKALIVTGKNSTKKSGLLDKAVSLLQKEQISSVIFDEVEPNPLTTTALKGAEIAKTQGCDLVIGLGGGSIMDCAKGIAFMAVNDGDINDYIFARQSSTKALPIILVPTTCGTGSEGNGFAVMTNPDNGDKKSLRCNAIIAKASIIDPLLMKTMPKGVLSSVGFDALCHNMEAYLSKSGQVITSALAMEGVRLIASSLVRVYRDYDDAEAWERLTLGSTLGGMVINTAGIAGPHALEHPASGLKNIVHGRGLAALTPVIYQASIKGAPHKFAAISQALGGTSEHDCVDTIRALLEDIDLKVGLSGEGITKEDIPWMVQNALKVSAAGLKSNPVEFAPDEIAKIYEEAL